MQTRSVLLVRSDEVGWTDLRQIVQSLPQARLIGEVETPVEALQLAAARQPDVIISAAELDDETTLPLLSALREQCPTSTLAIVASRYDPTEYAPLRDLGGVSYLLWGDFQRSRLQHGLALVIGGEAVVVSRSVLAALLDRQGGCGPVSPRVVLTERERLVLQGLARGQTRAQIAREGSLSQRTVERVIAALQMKLEAESLFALAVKAVQLGLLR